MIYIKLDEVLPYPFIGNNQLSVHKLIYGRITYIKNIRSQFISPFNWSYNELEITRDKRKSGYYTNTYYWYIAK